MPAVTFPLLYKHALLCLICNAGCLDKSWTTSQDKFSQIKTGDYQSVQKERHCLLCYAGTPKSSLLDIHHWHLI